MYLPALPLMASALATTNALVQQSLSIYLAAYALGMPGGLRIFGCVMQGMLNLVDHGMSLQEAVEAPRLWTQGDARFNGAEAEASWAFADNASGQWDLRVFGDDYPTPDGTGVRDYIHVVDLALGHLAALRYLQDKQASITVNLGTGRGVSVKELADTFARVTGVAVPYRFVDRRPGDVAACYADPQRAFETMGWKATRGLDEMCVDSWRWQSHNPHGFQD
mgnify:CR=1 FL=1